MNCFRLLLLVLFPVEAFAHVKWFSDYSFEAPPLKLSGLVGPTFIGLFGLSVISLPIMVWLDKVAERSRAYNATNAFLDQYSANGPLIMRVTVAAVLLMSWQGDSMVAPDIPIPSPVWGWVQFGLALLLLFRKTTFITGLGLILFWLTSVGRHGIFHMLDYVIYPAVGLYLILVYVNNPRIRNLDLPVLYSGLGFSLCWVAFEKLLYPFWGLSVLAQAPALTMGLNHEFFLMACAFIEFTLGYLLIICLLHRPLAVVITLVFFITTAFFGKTEVVGHTLLHGALLVFIVRGPGQHYQAPIRIHSSMWLRSLFAMVNFILLFVLMAWPYQSLAEKAYAKAQEKREKQVHPRLEIPEGAQVPEIKLSVKKDPVSGWNLQVLTENFTFTPQKAGGLDSLNEGHGHLFINGKKVGRIYSDWFHFSLPKGTHRVRVNLTSNSHMDYYHQGKPIEAQVEVTEEMEQEGGHGH